LQKEYRFLLEFRKANRASKEKKKLTDQVSFFIFLQIISSFGGPTFFHKYVKKSRLIFSGMKIGQNASYLNSNPLGHACIRSYKKEGPGSKTPLQNNH
jgi:hypothetical protein